MPRTTIPSDALVFFGATGDLAYKKIFPAIQTLDPARPSRRARSSASPSQAGASKDLIGGRDSLENTAESTEAAFAKLVKRLRYVDGDYNDPSTFEQLQQALGNAKRPLHYMAIPPSLFGTSRNIWPSRAVPRTPGS